MCIVCVLWLKWWFFVRCRKVFRLCKFIGIVFDVDVVKIVM